MMLQRTGAGRRHAEKQKADDRPILIGERLFMGSFQAACNGSALADAHVTHILSVISSGCVPADPRFTVRTVHIDDVERADLLSVLPDCLAFCDLALDSGGAVLIHCMSGVSRSAAVAMAFKMRREQLSVADALAALKAARPDVDPNAGFIEQLHQFAAMAFQLDGDTEAHATYRAATALRRRSVVTASPAASLDFALAKDPAADAKRAESLSNTYRCKACSRLLFSRRNLVRQAAAAAAAAEAAAAAPLANQAIAAAAAAAVGAPDEAASSKATRDDDGDDADPNDKKKKKKKSSSSSADRSKKKSGAGDAIYIEPMAWMQVNELASNDEGKINCPQCFARLGTWSWSGFESDGKLIVPAFKITRSKVERQETPAPSKDKE
jgi:predicted protein tyrosine phosphatase